MVEDGSFDTTKITHPSNGQFDASPTNSAVSVIVQMAKELGVRLDVDPIELPKPMSTGAKIVNSRTKRRN